MKTLVTGIAGFAGSHLAEYLVQNTQAEITGLIHGNNLSHISHLRDRITLIQGDVLDFEFVKSAVDGVQPDLIFHLAGQAAPSLSWKQPGATFVSNALGQLNVLEAVVQSHVPASVLVVGSGDEYGIVSSTDLPIKETAPLRPNSPYGVSKVAQDLLGYQYSVAYGVRTVRVRPFNHIGPRQSDSFVVSSFARQIAEAELGLRAPVIKVGNLEARRDFTDVRDVVRGYWLAMQYGETGEVYNIGSGASHSIAEILKTLLGIGKIALTVEQDPARMRPSDVPEIVSDSSKIRATTDWEPHFRLVDTLVDCLDYWRAVLSGRS